MQLFRWRAIVPMLLAVVVMALLWVLFVDRAVRRSVEAGGTAAVGAKVELAFARLRLRHADLVLRGLQVTDPAAPMRNLVEAEEIVADLDGRALLEAKVVIETLAVRGMRFGTARRTSGAVADARRSSGGMTRALAWATGIRIPTLDWEGLAGTVVRVDAISADSLRTLREARAAQALADSLRQAWEAEVRALDPRPQLDSARALLAQLQGMDVRRTDPVQLARTLAAARETVQRVAAAGTRITALRTRVDSGLAVARRQTARVDSARRTDYAWARGLLNIPSVDAPDISAALFGRMAVERLTPVIHWLQVAEHHLPPGLDPRRRRGPERLRMAGTTYRFPKARTWPAFLLERGEADLAIGGRTAAAGSYRALVRGLTTEPAAYGRPLTLGASRRSRVGPELLRVAGRVDRTGAVPRDSLAALVGGLTLPLIPIPQAKTRLDLGETTMELTLARSGDELTGLYRLTSPEVRWLRDADSAAAPSPAPRVGTRAWAEGLLWRSIASVPDAVIEAHLSGRLTSPRVSVTSNIGDAVAGSLRAAVGAEVERAQREARAQVDRLVAGQVARARAQVTALQTQVADRLVAAQEQLDQVRAGLDRQVQRLSQQVPGVRLPVRVPR
jgi:uncharacterized protein (TIGR03545 family)